MSSIRVGDCSLDLPIILDPKAATNQLGLPKHPAMSIAEEWGGKDFAKALGDSTAQPDLVDDDEQPAVRS